VVWLARERLRAHDGRVGSWALDRFAGPPMFPLTFLGTAASVPSAERNHPGLLLEAGGHRIPVDCGEGTQRQLLRAGAGFLNERCLSLCRLPQLSR
jgi:hypothetical protein